MSNKFTKPWYLVSDISCTIKIGKGYIYLGEIMASTVVDVEKVTIRSKNFIATAKNFLKPFLRSFAHKLITISCTVFLQSEDPQILIWQEK